MCALRHSLSVPLSARFLSLDGNTQKKLARSIGTSPDQVIENLREMDRASRLF